MRRGIETALLALALATAAAAIYVPGLDVAPIYLTGDEANVALHARAIAATGRDVDGHVLPLYFSDAGSPAGRDPIIVYATALVLKWRPFSEATVRLPTALVGVADVVLVFLLAQRLFKRKGLAIGAAGLLALSPAHFMHSRLSVSALYPLPFTLWWMLWLFDFLERPRLRALGAATFVLGLGLYSYVAALVMMPCYFLFTLVTLVHRKSTASQYVTAIAGFAAPSLPLLWWHIRHPARYAQLISSYRIYDVVHMSPLQGARDLASHFSLGVRSAVYWEFFNPSFLFFVGDTRLVDSTQRTGVFLWPVGILLMLGLYRVVAKERTWRNGLLVAAFLAAPLAAVLVAEVAIHRALLILPFGALIAAFGLDWLVSMRPHVGRVAAVVLLVFAALQFRSFYQDYFSDYRNRSAVAFGGNVRGGLDALIERDRRRPARAIYISRHIPSVDAYWSVYAARAGRDDLLTRTIYFDRPVSAASGLMLTSMRETATDALVGTNGWRLTDVISEPQGSASFRVYEK